MKIRNKIFCILLFFISPEVFSREIDTMRIILHEIINQLDYNHIPVKPWVQIEYDTYGKDGALVYCLKNDSVSQKHFEERTGLNSKEILNDYPKYINKELAINRSHKCFRYFKQSSLERILKRQNKKYNKTIMWDYKQGRYEYEFSEIALCKFLFVPVCYRFTAPIRVRKGNFLIFCNYGRFSISNVNIIAFSVNFERYGYSDFIVPLKCYLDRIQEF